MAGCGPEAPGGVVVTRTDSAGVLLVQNSGTVPEDGGGWSVGSEPVLSIGTLEGDGPYQFFQIAGVHRFSDGRIGVVNASSREVRIYSSEGIHLVSFGQRGAGPEEFEMPLLAGTLGDTLLIVDRAHHRLTFVHPDHGMGGPVRISDEVGGYLNPSGGFANGHTVYGGAFDMRRIGELRNGVNRAHTFYRSSNLEGSLVADFGDKDGADFFIRDLEGEGADGQPQIFPFGRIPMAAVSPHFFFFSDQGDYRIDVHNASGALVRLISKDWDAIPVTSEDVAQHIDNVVEQVGRPDQEAAIRARLGDLPPAEAFPPHGRLAADALDHLWVEDYQRPGFENTAWTIFDEDGVLTGRVALPERFNPMEIGADYVLGVGWDEMNVEYVKMYPLIRGSGGE
jgi:hypothetical protein